MKSFFDQIAKDCPRAYKEFSDMFVKQNNRVAFSELCKAQDAKSVKATTLEILLKVHAQLKYYLGEPNKWKLWDNIDQYRISLEGELQALKRGIDEK